jgi:PAS domain S-box-containing protein
MKRVLLVDDSPDGRYALAALLQRHGFVVDHASNGAEAIEVAQRNRPDLIVSDLLMPVMDGFTLLNHCKRDPDLRPIPFVVFTAACTDPRDASFATELGADAFLVKPLAVDELVAQLEIAMEEKANESELAGLSELDLLQHRHRSVLRKLAEKMRLLNRANRELELDIARRVRVEAELRESQTRFRQLAENIPEVFWIASPMIDRVHFVSAAYEKVWGRTCASLYEDGASWLAAIHPEDIEALKAEVFQQLSQRPGEAKYRILRADGEIRWLHTRTFPVRDEDQVDGARYIVGVSQDVTEQRRAQEQRKALEEQLLQTQKMEAIGTLAGGIAHDFNNILGVIGGNAELALREPDVPDGVRTGLDEIAKASKRAMRLVQQILTLSRRQTPELAVYELKPLVADAVQPSSTSPFHRSSPIRRWCSRCSSTSSPTRGTRSATASGACGSSWTASTPPTAHVARASA